MLTTFSHLELRPTMPTFKEKHFLGHATFFVEGLADGVAVLAVEFKDARYLTFAVPFGPCTNSETQLCVIGAFDGRFPVGVEERVVAGWLSSSPLFFQADYTFGTVLAPNATAMFHRVLVNGDLISVEKSHNPMDEAVSNLFLEITSSIFAKTLVGPCLNTVLKIPARLQLAVGPVG